MNTMRRLYYSLPLILTGMLAMAACDNSDRDMTPPVISEDGVVAQPVECDSYMRGDTIHFCYRLTDNDELGRFNLEVHSNHDHHTHSTSSVDCELDPVRQAVNPWVYNQDFDIPAGSSDFVAEADIPVPADVDTGDYHFMVRVTDRSGWQQLRSMAIKLQ